MACAASWPAGTPIASIIITWPAGRCRARPWRTPTRCSQQGDGFKILSDEDVVFASKGDSKLPIRLRRLRLERENGQQITLLTNDRRRSAVAIGALYKGRWQIELLFRWLKQNLKIRK